MPFRSQPFMRMMLVLIILLCAGISPNVFVAVQAGWDTFPVLLREWLLPSFLVLWVCVGLAYWMFDRSLARQVLIGAGSGMLATVGLEVVREIGFHIGWMPGDMPKLIGVLILNRFAMGPNGASNIAGWTYHCWNGACFGVIYTLLLGRGRVLWGGDLWFAHWSRVHDQSGDPSPGYWRFRTAILRRISVSHCGYPGSSRLRVFVGLSGISQ